MPDDSRDLISYLAAKKSVDDRCLNHRVWRTTWESLPAGKIRVLEIGCGIGTMLERVLERGVLLRGDYEGVDINPALTVEAERRLRQWASATSVALVDHPDHLHVSGGARDLRVSFHEADATSLAAAGLAGEYTVLIASAFLDLVDLETTLPKLLNLLQPGGIFYFPITFDGLTSFLPGVNPELERKVEKRYHQTMDERTVGGMKSGASQTGRKLLSYLLASSHEILAAGPSDWVVVPQEGGYPAREDTFLDHILDTVETALKGDPYLEPSELQVWLRSKRQLLSEGKLIYLAHQIDVCGRIR
jgi:ubiquinone/menaquinone biosynthesis C-methylase UbiE